MQQGATLAGALIDTFIDAGESHNFIEPRETLSLITPDTLLIVVDTYQKYLLESREIYEKCKRVVVIDHHRMAVGHIDNPVLLYHEPYASSASELVCELLQFMPSADNITPLEAQALLAGIMLDTRSFALHVGVRTFEAAAWLRSRGAKTAETKLLFNTSKEEYEARAAIVESAYIYKGCAIALSQELPARNVGRAAHGRQRPAHHQRCGRQRRRRGQKRRRQHQRPQHGRAQRPGHSGGGWAAAGHLTMAGAQLKDCTLKEAESRIRAEIDRYREAQSAEKAAALV